MFLNDKKQKNIHMHIYDLNIFKKRSNLLFYCFLESLINCLLVTVGPIISPSLSPDHARILNSFETFTIINKYTYLDFLKYYLTSIILKSYLKISLVYKHYSTSLFLKPSQKRHFNLKLILRSNSKNI